MRSTTTRGRSCGAGPGDRGQAAELLTSAAASARALGMRSLADKVSSLG